MFLIVIIIAIFLAYTQGISTDIATNTTETEDNIDICTAVIVCETTKGDIEIEVYRDWSPIGADRFVELVNDGFYTDIALYRSVPNFLVQFGISDNNKYFHWHGDQIPDDPNLDRGIWKYDISFAGAGPNTRSTQLFIAYNDLDFLGKEPWETAFGHIVSGQEVVDSFYQGYEDIPPFGNGPDQSLIYDNGNDYIRNNFPLTDFINKCFVTETNEL